MEVSDDFLFENRDWDPSYLQLLFRDDFNDVTELWKSNIRDEDLIAESNRVESQCEHYCPVTEDISLDDTVLYDAVEKIEEESVAIVLLIVILNFVI